MFDPIVCLATAIFFEARDQPRLGQELVAETVINRVDDPRWPSTICGVVFQERQMSFTHDGMSDLMEDYNEPADLEAQDEAFDVAETVLERRDNLKTNANHFHTTGVAPKWKNTMKPVAYIGKHIFYVKE